jgi:hypothetical protein
MTAMLFATEWAVSSSDDPGIAVRLACPALEHIAEKQLLAFEIRPE